MHIRRASLNSLRVLLLATLTTPVLIPAASREAQAQNPEPYMESFICRS
jgi:hypothetical protein